MFGDIEQKHGLGFGRRGLHQDRSLDPRGGKMRRQVREPKVTIDRRQFWRQPAIIAPARVHRCDAHQSTSAGQRNGRIRIEQILSLQIGPKR